jgi:hypothetical protein
LNNAVRIEAVGGGKCISIVCHNGVPALVKHQDSADKGTKLSVSFAVEKLVTDDL